jgi:transaldolase
MFVGLAIEDLTRTADLFRPIHNRTAGVDGWVSLEASPLLAHDTTRTVMSARQLHAQAGRPNLFIKIPGTKEGLPAIEEAIFAGVHVNVTLLFSREQYLAAAEAFLRGIERRIEAGLAPTVSSVASVFISRWDVAVSGRVPDSLRNRLGVAIANALMRPIARSSRHHAGSASSTSEHALNDCSGQAPEPRIRRPRTFCMSRRSRRRSR